MYVILCMRICYANMSFFHQNCLDKSLMVFMFLLCGYVTLLRIFTHDKPKKNKWSHCCLLRVRVDWKFLENMQNSWLCQKLDSWTFSSLLIFSAYDKWDRFWLTSFKSCIHHWITLLNLIHNGGAKKLTYQFFPCNFYKHRN